MNWIAAEAPPLFVTNLYVPITRFSYTVEFSNVTKRLIKPINALAKRLINLLAKRLNNPIVVFAEFSCLLQCSLR